MKASELIKHLEEQIKMNGDINVEVLFSNKNLIVSEKKAKCWKAIMLDNLHIVQLI